MIPNPLFSIDSSARGFARAGALVCAALCLTTWLAGCSSTKDSSQAKLTTADEVVVDKSDRRLKLMKGGQVMKEYRVALGKDPVGPKFREGDQRTPEGEYVLDWRNHRSNYYKALHVSYPNPDDRLRAEEERLGAAARMQQAIGEHVPTLGIGGKLHFVDGQEIDIDLARLTIP